MLVFGQTPGVSVEPLPTSAATEPVPPSEGKGWTVFAVMASCLTLVIGYAIGFERGTGKTGGRRYPSS